MDLPNNAEMPNTEKHTRYYSTNTEQEQSKLIYGIQGHQLPYAEEVGSDCKEAQGGSLGYRVVIRVLVMVI